MLREQQPKVREQQPSLGVFAAGMIGLGVLALVYGDFAMVWQPVAPWVPGRTLLAYASGLLMLLCGTGLLFQKTVRWSVGLLLPYLIVWTLLKVPALIVAPQIEGVWLGIGELIMLLAGGWTLFAIFSELPEHGISSVISGANGYRVARVLFGVAVLPVGLSHLVYVIQTVELIPAWLPFRPAWAYLTGTGHMASGVGILLSLLPGTSWLPRLAAWAEAGMLSVITLLVWVPAIVTAPRQRSPWTAFFISWAITAAVFVIAQNMPVNKRV